MSGKGKDIFLSYATKNRPFVEKIKCDLERQTDYSIWMDKDEIRGGHDWAKEIESNLRNCKVLIVTATIESDQSKWVNRECILAENLNKKIIPLLRSGDEPPFMLIDLQFIDFRDDEMYTQQLKALVDVLKCYIPATVKATAKHNTGKGHHDNMGESHKKKERRSRKNPVNMNRQKGRAHKKSSKTKESIKKLLFCVPHSWIEGKIPSKTEIKSAEKFLSKAKRKVSQTEQGGEATGVSKFLKSLKKYLRKEKDYEVKIHEVPGKIVLKLWVEDRNIGPLHFKPNARTLRLLLEGINTILPSLQVLGGEYHPENFSFGGVYEGSICILFQGPEAMIQSFVKFWEQENQTIDLLNGLVLTDIYSLFAVSRNEEQELSKFDSLVSDEDSKLFRDDQQLQHSLFRLGSSLENILEGLHADESQYLFEDEDSQFSDFTSYKDDIGDDFTFLIPSSNDFFEAFMENDEDYWYSMNQVFSVTGSRLNAGHNPTSKKEVRQEDDLTWGSIFNRYHTNTHRDEEPDVSGVPRLRSVATTPRPLLDLVEQTKLGAIEHPDARFDRHSDTAGNEQPHQIEARHGPVHLWNLFVIYLRAKIGNNQSLPNTNQDTTQKTSVLQAIRRRTKFSTYREEDSNYCQHTPRRGPHRSGHTFSFLGRKLSSMKLCYILQAVVVLGVTNLVWEPNHKPLHGAQQLAQTNIAASDALHSPGSSSVVKRSKRGGTSHLKTASEPGEDGQDAKFDSIHNQTQQLYQMEVELKNGVGRTSQLRIQELARKFIIQEFGEGPIQVVLELDFGKNGNGGGVPKAISILLWHETPYAAWTWLEQIRRHIWDGSEFSGDEGHAVNAAPSHEDPMQGGNIAFVEQSQHGHEAWTVGLHTNDEGKLSMYINLADNTNFHKHETCVGKVIDGFDALQRLLHLSRNGKYDSWIQIKKASAMRTHTAVQKDGEHLNHDN